MKTGYVINKQTGKVDSYFEYRNIPKNTGVHEFVECDKKDFPDILPAPLTEDEKVSSLIGKEIKQMAITSLTQKGHIEMKDGKLKLKK